MIKIENDLSRNPDDSDKSDKMPMDIAEFITSKFMTVMIIIGVIVGYSYTRNITGTIFGATMGAVIGLLFSK